MGLYDVIKYALILGGCILGLLMILFPKKMIKADMKDKDAAVSKVRQCGVVIVGMMLLVLALVAVRQYL